MKRKPQSERKWLTIEEVADELGISRTSAFAAAHRGEIKYVRIGKLMRVPRQWFTSLFEAHVSPEKAP